MKYINWKCADTDDISGIKRMHVGDEAFFLESLVSCIKYSSSEVTFVRIRSCSETPR